MQTLMLFLPGIVYLGLITSYTDIMHGKIKNRDVLIGVAYAILVNLGIISYMFFSGMEGSIAYFMNVMKNGVISLLLAYALWHFKIWSAGDGKLFFAFTMLIPLGVYVNGRYDLFPSLSFLLNLFITGLLAMVFMLGKDARLWHYKKAFVKFIKNFFNPGQLIEMNVSLFALFWLVQITLAFLGLGGDFLLRYLFTIIAFSSLSKITFNLAKKNKALKNVKLYILGCVSILRLVIDKGVYTYMFLWNFIFLIFVWRFARRLFMHGSRSLANDVFSDYVKVDKLKPGMILADKIVKKKLSKKEKEMYTKMKDVVFVTKGKMSYLMSSEVKGKCIIDAESEGITEKHVGIIKSLGLQKVRICRTIPFAPFIFAGVLLTLLAKGNILILLLAF